MSLEDAVERVGSGQPDQVRGIDGQFALLHKQGNIVRMARSIGRPMRFFLAKLSAGPMLIVAERMDEIQAFLTQEGIADQFHPSYTRMIPAHYITEIALVGCPDPNPVHTRFLNTPPEKLSTDLDEIGRVYIETLAAEIQRWFNTLNEREPIGVLFSGGVDSGAVLVLAHHLLLQSGQPAQRLKAFTLTIDDQGSDLQQASQFLKSMDLDYLLEAVNVDAGCIDYQRAIQVIEDYKPLDVQSATMATALCTAIRERYPDWRYLLDGDGGDENLRDYPIEDNPELTIRSVLNNPFFYQEGWGVDKVKHSLTYSGGQSRGHVRTYAPASVLGFSGFSPFATPNVIAVAERIPFIELTDWDHEKLYALKGEITRRGIQAVTGKEMPVYQKNRFQHGVTSSQTFGHLFPDSDEAYRQTFAKLFTAS
ncbi:MAG TPA: asparagine synthase [Planctomycetaceae bacterium]|nr:asparagine synthase [Planctomycetaceae bacterium]